MARRGYYRALGIASSLQLVASVRYSDTLSKRLDDPVIQPGQILSLIGPPRRLSPRPQLPQAVWLNFPQCGGEYQGAKLRN